ncbi:MAG: peptidylprolyl isomerase [Chitinophagaceae bacterium]|nr:peptidylprolyl isomerase [Chitinophagaceae bacterium]
MKKLMIVCSMMGLFSQNLSAQKKDADPVLFTYGGQPVAKKEFLRMYTKNLNTQKPDFSEKAVREYLTLYSRFKMKVAEAQAMKLDTLKSIDGELTSYKKQLAKTYLTDNEVKDKLVKEAYDRMKKEVEVAHILVSYPRGTDDTLEAKNKIDSLYREVTMNKADFAKLANQYSEDKQSAVNGGNIGYLTALQFVYAFENDAYKTPIGQYSKPFKTIFGYHIIKKLNERPNRGELQVAQLLIQVRKSEGEAGEKAAKQKADSLVAVLRKGGDFKKMVELYSDDKFSKNSDGELPSFGVGAMDPTFENAAFALKNPGDISNPILTKYGFHIIKLLKKIPLRPLDSIRGDLTRRVEKDGRMDFAKVEYTNRTKERLQYKEFPEALTQLINGIKDSDLQNGNFKANDYKNYTKPLFEMAGTQVTQKDFANYIEAYTKGRIYGTKESSLRSLFKNYAEKVLYDHQEEKLMEENEDYRNLINEYKDGIMLFELTDRMVWSKASTDTVGLKKFHEANSSKYIWPPSLKGRYWKTQDEETMKLLVKELSKSPKPSPDDIMKELNASVIKATYEQGKFEQGRFLDEIKMEPGKFSQYFKNDDGSYSLMDVDEKFDTGTEKTLSEARGLVVSDYQEYLEKYWIAELEMKYPVKTNEAVLKSIIK